MKVFVILCCFTLLLSCGKQKTQSQADGKGGNTSSEMGSDTSKPVPKPEVGAAKKAEVGKTTLTVENDTKSKLTFGVGWGDYRPFRLSFPGKTEFHLLEGCLCKGDGQCMKSSQPPLRNIVLEPGKSFSYEWKGHIVVWKKSLKNPGSRYCVDTALSPGEYVISVCTNERKCASTKVNLPSKKPVVIKMSTMVASSQ